ncbi:hypothetical protein RI543_002152 [Arxiozyma heterogenica]|uniref:mitogen-activated protein kinase kinase kinase n=1 Tax=Arxiozyma heterogenica TaxID=278026 RepID=A0AAN7W3H5_9SACH|nr:hypothetical protein RI543_002152 [Kazachstania heterogenica]
MNSKNIDHQFIEQFLSDINCSQYTSNFIQFRIFDKKDLYHIDKEILFEIGIRNLGDRLRILRKIKLLNDENDNKILNINELSNIINKFRQLGSLNQHSSNSSYNHKYLSDFNYNNPENLDYILPCDEEYFTEKHHIIFILNDGTAKKIDVNGCFNANSIKKRLIKTLPKQFQILDKNKNNLNIESNYDVFIVDYKKNVLHLLYDVELITICHSLDRWERNRLIFVSKDQTPSDLAILTSKKIYLKTLSLTNNNQLRGSKKEKIYNGHLKMDNSKDNIRKVFNQRPSSEYITTNLSGYFPNTNIEKLQKTLRNSYRQSIRMSHLHPMNYKPSIISSESNNVGNILLKHTTDVDKALLQNLNNSTTNIRNRNPNTRSNILFRNHATSSDAKELHLKNKYKDSNMNSEAFNDREYNDDDKVEEEDNKEGGYDTDVVSLPTKMVTPKSWLKGARIGSGSFGSVYLGMNAQTGEIMAVKQVAIQPPPSTLSTPPGINNSNKMDPSLIKRRNESNIFKKMVESLQHEMNLLKELHHENIVTYYGSSQENGNLNIFLEYVPGGSVSSMLNSYGPFEESLITNFTRQILIGLTYLHNKNIIHRDIKGANILIDIRGCVKITDFGISKKLSPLNNSDNDAEDSMNKKQNKRASLQGSVYWMAPEVVKQTTTTEKADIWSTGCVVIEMFTGRHPYPDFSQMQALFKIGTNMCPEIPSWATSEAQNFLKQTFKLDYQKRPSAIELLQHTWLDTHLLS